MFNNCKKVAAPKAVPAAGDVYTGTDTVKYLATGVADRVFLQQIVQD